MMLGTTNIKFKEMLLVVQYGLSLHIICYLFLHFTLHSHFSELQTIYGNEVDMNDNVMNMGRC